MKKALEERLMRLIYTNNNDSCTKTSLITNKHFDLFKVVSGLNDTEYQTTELQPGEKIAQAILIPISTEEIEQISNEEYDNLPTTSRGAGGFGSTGVK